MPRADTHESARRGAQLADDALKSVEDAKHQVAVDKQQDVFALNAERARREGWRSTEGPKHGS